LAEIKISVLWPGIASIAGGFSEAIRNWQARSAFSAANADRAILWIRMQLNKLGSDSACNIQH
jgi:hypothetical protein